MFSSNHPPYHHITDYGLRHSGHVAAETWVPKELLRAIRVRMRRYVARYLFWGKVSSGLYL